MNNLFTERKLIEGLTKSDRDLWESVFEFQALVHAILTDKYKEPTQAIAAPTTDK